jgi:dTMP kinase
LKTARDDKQLAKRLAGKFIVIDGPDGSGKTVMRRHLHNWLKDHGHKSVSTVREPGGTAYGERIRDVVLTREPGVSERLDPYAETLLFFAARVQLLRQVIIPALAAGTTVLTDRFVSSTLAYQGEGLGVPWDHILAVANTVIPEAYKPFCTIVLDVIESVAATRRKAEPDRIELRDAAFRQRVRLGYLKQVALYPQHTIWVDANGSESQTFAQILCGLRVFTAQKPVA